MKTTPLRTASTFRPFQPSAFRLSGLLLLLLLPLRADITERPDTQGDAFRVVSANTRQLYGVTEVDNAPTDLNSWLYRKDILRDTLLAQHADIIAFQEGRQEQLDYLLPFMPNFAFFRLATTNAAGAVRPANPGNAILYNTDRFEFIRGDGFYLCENPREVQGSYPESLSIRFANWAILRDKRTGHDIQFCALHLDHLTGTAGAELRGKQVAVALAAMNGLRTGAPQILVGDFNGTALTDQTYYFYSRVTLQNGWTDTWIEAGNPNNTTALNPNPTSNPNFAGATTGNKIDYIFRRGPLVTTRAEIINDYIMVDSVRRYPSDHYFISADLEYDGPIVETGAITTLPTTEFVSPVGIAVTAQNDVYVADEGANQIKRVTGIGTAEAKASVFAGIGGPGFQDNTNGAFAFFLHPRSIAWQDGFWYVADHGNRVLRAIKADTTAVSLFAGSPPASYAEPALSLDGDLESARFAAPSSIAIAPDASIYVADSTAHVIRKISSAGAVTTLAGSPGSSGSANGPASSATFNEPLGLALDATAQNLYVADAANHTIRKIDLTTSTVTTLAGSPGYFGSADGLAAAARFNTPSALTVINNTVYVADTANHTIRAIDAATGATTLLAGTPGVQMPIIGITKAIRDGSPADALFSYPSGITADAAGNLYVADTGNGAIRYINLAAGDETTTPFSTSAQPDYGEGGPGAPKAREHRTGGALSPLYLLSLALLTLIRRRP